MTDIKKTAKDKGGAKAKLQLKKETIKDLTSLKGKAAAIKGGRAGCPFGTACEGSI